MRPHRQQPTWLPRPWDSPGKNTGVGCHCFSSAWKWKGKVKLLSHVWLLATPWTAAHQAPHSMGFSRQEYWSGVPLPSPTVTWYMVNGTPLPILLVWDTIDIPLFNMAIYILHMDFPGGSDSDLPAVQESWVWSLGSEDPLEKGMATHSSILAWRIPWMEEPEFFFQSLYKKIITRKLAF